MSHVSHVHASYLRGPPSRPPLSRAEESLSPRYAESRLRLSHSSLQVPPEGARISGANSMPASRGEQACVCVWCESLDAVERAVQGFRHPLHHHPHLAGCLRPRQTGSCWRQLSATGSCSKPRFPQQLE